jgi:glycosyltransferase involved in cell wall biosynthesis
MKLALVHDYLVQDGGAERVLQALQEIWPEAPTFTLFFDPDRLPAFRGRDVRTSFLQRAPLIKTKYQMYVALMPTAVEQLDLTDYDVVLSNASAFAKGVIVRRDALHLCYCHTPTRYLWSDTHSYVQELRLPRMAKSLLLPVLSYLRLWDRQAAERVDHFIANSRTVQERIKKYYRRDAHVIHPPVEVDRFSISHEPKTYFLAGGRLVAYKRFDVIVEAANRTGLPVKIFGTGPIEHELRERARPNVEFLGKVSDEERARLYANAKAYIHPQEEDFGITAVESMASGRPVLAFRKGGATETVIDGVTGQFLEDQSWEELADAMIRFEEGRWDPVRIRAHAETFHQRQFQETVRQFVEDAWKRHAEQH